MEASFSLSSKVSGSDGELGAGKEVTANTLIHTRVRDSSLGEQNSDRGNHWRTGYYTQILTEGTSTWGILDIETLGRPSYHTATLPTPPPPR